MTSCAASRDLEVRASALEDATDGSVGGIEIWHVLITTGPNEI